MRQVLVVIPWAGSLVFSAVLAFRLGYWWRGTELLVRHAVGNVARLDDPWVAGDQLAADAVDDAAEGLKFRSGWQAQWSWYSEPDAATEVLPRITGHPD